MHLQLKHRSLCLEDSCITTSGPTMQSAPMPKYTLSFLFVLFFLSGAAGLLYQVMWMKELSLLLGSSTQSAAVTTAAFFLGLGLGAQSIGKWVKSRPVPRGSHLRQYLGYYAALEVAIALSALLYFLIYPAFNAVYASVFETLSDLPSLLLLVKLLLAMALLSIPAFFMGGTLPVMAELVVDAQSAFARRVAGIYFINTLGACAGAIAGGFWLPRVLGFTQTYLIAIATSLMLAVAVWAFRHFVSGTPGVLKDKEKTAKPEQPKASATTSAGPMYILWISAWSGFASLALQVLWTRLFAQVLQNSTYTYSAILAVFLFALTAGAFIARKLAQRKQSPNVLAVIMLVSGLLVALTPSLFMYLTDDMSYVGGGVALTGYIVEVIGLIALTIGPAVLVMGIGLPYLYKLAEKDVGDRYAQVVGRINSINTYAAIFGSLLAGFVLFYWLGTWQAIHSIALVYMLAALLLLVQQSRHIGRRSAFTFGATAVVIILLNPGKLTVVPFDPINKKERVLEYWEGSAGTVAVVDKDGNLKTKLNNWYALGGSKASQMEAMQTHLPINLHGKADSVFYLGLGTGITAGTVIDYPTQKVVVAELIKEVITASEKYFAEYNNGLFEDTRVSVVNEDGRHYLQASKEHFDLIIADLFIPWRSGVGSLYALEHYQNALARLNEKGYYVQWLPMYQISQAEFSVIAKTMTQVFPLVTAWRGDFFASKPVMALIGHKTNAGIQDQRLFRQASLRALQNYPTTSQVPLLSHYVGQVRPELPFVADAPINSDDNPIIEYQAPVSHRAEKNGQLKWLTGADLLAVMRQMQSPQDTFLQGISEREAKAVYAGYFLHAAQVARDLGDQKARQQAMAQFNALIGPGKP